MLLIYMYILCRLEEKMKERRQEREEKEKKVIYFFCASLKVN